MRKELHKVKREEVSSEAGAERDVYLTERDIPRLIELTVSSSHKWEEIGVPLGLPEYVREECTSTGSNPLRLTKILTAWMSGNSEAVKNVTLSSLKSALSSRTFSNC